MVQEVPGREQIVKTFGREAADFIELAASLGWKVMSSLKGASLTLIPYDDSVRGRIHLSSRNKGGGLKRKHGKTLVKYAKPEHREWMTELAQDGTLPEGARDYVAGVVGKTLLNREDGIFTVEEEVEIDVPVEVPKPSELDKRLTEKVKRERHIVSKRPALMHLGITQQGGRSYPSKTTVERSWSDGSTDYACSVPTCDMTSDNRRSFAGAHWAMHVRNGEAEAHDSDEARRSAVDDPSYTETAYSRKQMGQDRRTADLTNLLKGINLTTISPEELAEQIVAYLGDLGGGGGSGSGEPLTDQQVLDRIRTLVDRGTYAEQEAQIKQMSQDQDELARMAQEREAELDQRLLLAEQRATRAESHLTALKELIGEIKYGEED